MKIKYVFEFSMSITLHEIQPNKHANQRRWNLIFSSAVVYVGEADREKWISNFRLAKELLVWQMEEDETIKFSKARSLMQCQLHWLASPRQLD